ncbi:hypothetical protein [Morganella morganii]|uniref:hypothetical protein n=1 Tax=Morganella morganii TaxID=582 RepID=UPI001BD9B141|nr:hypothetical protein [Morganella morganii]MBT0456864.1 hypothetical protein [Morganella morganii subsp. morganii]
MTVSTELSHEEYTGNGVTTDFDFRFRILKAEHLVVSVADQDGTERTLTNGTDYTLRGVDSYRGGKVILKMPLATGWKIGITRDLPVVQETDLRNQGKFFAEVHEDAFDYLTMLIQKSLGYLSLCLRKPSFISDHYDAKGNKISNLGKPVKDGDAVDLSTMKEHISAKDKRSLRVADKDIPALPNTANRANKVLSFDKDGYPVVVIPESGSAADVLIELSKNGGDRLIGSSFGNTVYADYSRLTITRKASFADGGILNSDKEAALAGDGFFYVYKGAYPVTITPGSSPDSNWLCCGLLNGYPLHNFKNFKGTNSDTDALTKCIDFNNFVHIDENTEIYIEPIVLTKSMTIRIDGVVYAGRNCPDLCVLISATGVDDITIEGHGRIDGNEKEVTSSKMRLIHLTGGGNRHRVYGITLGNNYISEADYTGYAESTLWIDGGVEHEVRGVRLVDYGLEGISVCAKRSIISDIVSTSSYGKTGGTRCLNYSTIHTLGSDFIISRIISYNTGASAIGCDSTHTVITDIDIDTVRYQHGIGVGHPNKPGSYTIINNCIIKNIMHPSGNNRGGIGIGEETHDVRINNVKVIGSTNMGINVSSGATEVDISNFYAESCDVALSIFNANCSVDGMKVKSCSNGISKRQVNDKLTLSNVNLTGATTKILGSEDNISGVNVIFNSDFPRQGVVQISNRTLPVSVENPNIRPWSTLSITPNSANSASSVPYVSETLYGILRINAVNSPTHYAGVKWFIA